MKYSIQKTDDGWKLCNANDETVATFIGDERTAYDDAVAHLGALGSRQLADAVAPAAEGAPAPAPTDAEAGLLPEHWTSGGDGIAFCEALPGGRDFTNCTWTWRDPATNLVPLMLQTANEGGHWGAELAGFVVAFSGGGNAQVDVDDGRFFDNEAGVQFRDLLLGGRKFGVSVDPSEAIDVDETFECTGWDEEGFCIDGAYSMAFNAYEIAGLTGVPFPGFEDAAIKLAASRMMFSRDASGIRLVESASKQVARAAERRMLDSIPAEQNDHVIVKASALSIPVAPPRAWFDLPEPDLGEPFLDGLGDDVLVPQGDDSTLACPPHYGDDGQVYGHLTYWGQCHVGMPWGPGRCASAPASSNDYADFHASGYVKCDDGTELPIGLLHVGCEHSDAMNVRDVRDAAAHAGLAFAAVRMTDGKYGPWMSGTLLPTVTDEQVVKLRALTLSGEWVPELGAVIAVNDGGLPQRRRVRIAASGGGELIVPELRLAASRRGGKLAKMIGGNPVHRCGECEKRRREMRAGAAPSRVEQLLAQMAVQLAEVERRTRHLADAEAEATARRLTVA